jgi:hypothetical protein
VRENSNLDSGTEAVTRRRIRAAHRLYARTCPGSTCTPRPPHSRYQRRKLAVVDRVSSACTRRGNVIGKEKVVFSSMRRKRLIIKSVHCVFERSCSSFQDDPEGLPAPAAFLASEAAICRLRSASSSSCLTNTWRLFVSSVPRALRACVPYRRECHEDGSVPLAAQHGKAFRGRRWSRWASVWCLGNAGLAHAYGGAPIPASAVVNKCYCMIKLCRLPCLHVCEEEDNGKDLVPNLWLLQPSRWPLSAVLLFSAASLYSRRECSM